MWDPTRYLTYADERARPFHELLSRVRAERPATVVDLGCGPGTLTATLADRWPAARVVGIDSSTEMIAAAKPLERPNLQFTLGTVKEWRPQRPVDVIVSNATLQWVPEHRELLPGLVSALSPVGWLAIQVPGNLDSPSHTILRDLRLSPRWRQLVGEGADRHLAVAEPQQYLHQLAELDCAVDVWETTYFHVLNGPDPVFEWMSGTGLRPVLAALDESHRTQFGNELRERLRGAYPSQRYGTVFPFRRIFVVAQRAA
jgi:trans-aconitate 2-methyltransferase